LKPDFLAGERNFAASPGPLDALERLDHVIGIGGTRDFRSPGENRLQYHQWLDIPYVTFQVTAVKQPVADMKLVQDPGKDIDCHALEKTK